MLRLADVDHLLAVEHRLGLEGFELQRTLRAPPRAQLLGHAVLGAQLGIQARHLGRRCGQRARTFKPGGQRVIGQLGLVAHPCPVNGRSGQAGIGVEHHFGHHRQPVLVCVERSQVGRQALWQHGENTRTGVDRRSVVARMGVDGAALLDQQVHVGNGHQNLHRAARQHFAHAKLVQVARIVVVDGTPQQCRQVADAGAILQTSTRDAIQLAQRIGWKLGVQAARKHGFGGDGSQIGARVGVRWRHGWVWCGVCAACAEVVKGTGRAPARAALPGRARHRCKAWPLASMRRVHAPPRPVHPAQPVCQPPRPAAWRF